MLQFFSLMCELSHVVGRYFVITDIIVMVVLVISDGDRWLHTTLLGAFSLRPPSLFHGMRFIALGAGVILWLTNYWVYSNSFSGCKLIRIHTILYGLGSLRKKEFLHGDLDWGARGLLMLHVVHGLIHLIFLIHFVIVHVSPLSWGTLGMIHFIFSFLAFLPFLA